MVDQITQLLDDIDRQSVEARRYPESAQFEELLEHTGQLAQAVRAVLELHKTRVHDEDPTSPFCNICGTVIGQSCESLQAITDVFEDVADGQALDQARAEDDGTRITLDKYLEDDDD